MVRQSAVTLSHGSGIGADGAIHVEGTGAPCCSPIRIVAEAQHSPAPTGTSLSPLVRIQSVPGSFSAKLDALRVTAILKRVLAARVTGRLSSPEPDVDTKRIGLEKAERSEGDHESTGMQFPGDGQSEAKSWLRKDAPLAAAAIRLAAAATSPSEYTATSSSFGSSTFSRPPSPFSPLGSTSGRFELCPSPHATSAAWLVPGTSQRAAELSRLVNSAREPRSRHKMASVRTWVREQRAATVEWNLQIISAAAVLQVAARRRAARRRAPACDRSKYLDDLGGLDVPWAASYSVPVLDRAGPQGAGGKLARGRASSRSAVTPDGRGIRSGDRAGIEQRARGYAGTPDGRGSARKRIGAGGTDAGNSLTHVAWRGVMDHWRAALRAAPLVPQVPGAAEEASAARSGTSGFHSESSQSPEKCRTEREAISVGDRSAVSDNTRGERALATAAAAMRDALRAIEAPAVCIHASPLRVAHQTCGRILSTPTCPHAFALHLLSMTRRWRSHRLWCKGCGTGAISARQDEIRELRSVCLESVGAPAGP